MVWWQWIKNNALSKASISEFSLKKQQNQGFVTINSVMPYDY
jgi:hypothetical protein